MIATIVTAVLKATMGLIMNKGRQLAADKLQEGDVTMEGRIAVHLTTQAIQRNKEKHVILVV